MTNQITYEFEELTPFPGHAVYIHGTADIEYEKDPGDAYSGTSDGWSYSITRISINADKKDLGDLNLDGAHPLWDLIEAQLLSSKWDWHIIEKIDEREEIYHYG